MVTLIALDGAVYTPVVLIIPTVELPPAMLFTDQLTAAFVVPVTVAVKESVSPVPIVALAGKTWTRTPESIVTVALAVTAALAAAIATTETVGGFGNAAGAVYKPVELTVPSVELPPGTGVPDPWLTAQFTVMFEMVPVTVAVNCSLPFRTTVAEVGAMVIPTGVLLPPPQPASKPAISTVAPSFNDFMPSPPYWPARFFSPRSLKQAPLGSHNR
jgi:hypothetical protein